MGHLTAFFTCCLIGAQFSAAPVAAQNPMLRIFGAQTQMSWYETQPLTEDQQVGLAQFQNEISYFGGFAIDPVGGAWGYTGGYHMQAIAEIAAQHICEGYSDGAPCRVIAAIIPASLPPGTRNAAGLNHSAEVAITQSYLKSYTEQAQGNFAAFAIGGRAWAYETAGSTPDEARHLARSLCEQTEQEDNRAGVAPEIAEALNRLGAFECRVVDVRQITEP
ncbi:MAG: hypothetical protein ABJL67_20840 [Sulfitobacter sp.]